MKVRCHHRLLLRAVSVFGICLAGAYQQNAYADLPVDQFREKYSTAVTQLDAAYRNVQITGTLTYTYWAKNQLFSRKEQFEMRRNGDSVRDFRKTLSSKDPAWLEGSISIGGGTPDLSFFCTKQPSEKGFTFSWFGPDPEFINKAQLYAPCFAPSYVLDSNLASWFKENKITSVRSADFNGNDALDVSSEFMFQRKTELDHFFLEPNSFAIVGWHMPRRTNVLQGNVRYGPLTSDSIPKIARMECIEENSAVANSRRESVYEISDVKFVVTPQEEFKPPALKQFGVTDIPAYEEAAPAIPIATSPARVSVKSDKTATVSGVAEGQVNPSSVPAAIPGNTAFLGKAQASVPIFQRISPWFYAFAALFFLTLGVTLFIKLRRAGPT